MSKLSQSELKSIIAKQSQLPPSVVDEFVKQLFAETEVGLLKDSSSKIDGLGSFKIIKGAGASTDKVLFFPTPKGHLRLPSASELRSDSTVSESKSPNKIMTDDEMFESSEGVEIYLDSDDIHHVDNEEIRQSNLKTIILVVFLIAAISAAILFIFFPNVLKSDKDSEVNKERVCYDLINDTELFG